jgi:hypothetical protein
VLQFEPLHETIEAFIRALAPPAAKSQAYSAVGNTLKTYAGMAIGGVPVRDIDTRGGVFCLTEFVSIDRTSIEKYSGYRQ